MGYIYISYSRQNTEIAQRLVASLQERGYTIWVDSEDLKPGAQWGEQIAEAIADAEVFITLLSSATAGNRTVQNEIELALARRKPIIPVLIEAATIPASLANRQVVDAAGGWDDFIERLTNAIDASTASLHMRRVEVPLTAPVATPTPAAARSDTTRMRLMLFAVTLALFIAVVLLAVSFSFQQLRMQSTDGESDEVAAQLTATSISARNATLAAQASQTQQAVAALASQTGQAPLTETLTEMATPSPSATSDTTGQVMFDLTMTTQALTPDRPPTIAMNAVMLTATALADLIRSTEIAGATQTREGGFLPTTEISGQGGGNGLLGTEVARAVEGTVMAFSATEASQLSPAEAAQMMSLTSGDNNLLFAVGVLSALALGISVTTLYVMWTGSDLRRARWRTAHSSAHHSGELPAQPKSVLTETMLEDYQIFVSSSEKDKAWVQILVEDLEALDYAVWWYAKDAPGLPFGNEIRSAIYHTKVFLIVVSPDSMRSKHIEEEIRWAEIYDRPIIPVECRTTSIEERFYGLAKGADIDFTDEGNYKAALEFLTQAVDRHLQQRLEKMHLAPSGGE